MNFLEEIIEDPLKLWSSVIVVLGLLFYIFSGGSNDKVATSDPFSDSSSFVSKGDMQDNSSFKDSTPDNQQFQEPKFTYTRPVLNQKTGFIEEKEFDMQGHEITKPNNTQDKDKRIEKLEKKVRELEKKVEKDPFSSSF